MSGKRRLKKLKRKARVARQDASRPKPVVTPVKMVRCYCEECGRYHEAPDQNSQPEPLRRAETDDRQALQYTWEELVRRHGEEGAAIIADCL